MICLLKNGWKKIIDILYRDGKVVVKDLSKQFGISQDAIRKDLKVLEKKKGLLKGPMVELF